MASNTPREINRTIEVTIRTALSLTDFTVDEIVEYVETQLGAAVVHSATPTEDIVELMEGRGYAAIPTARSTDAMMGYLELKASFPSPIAEILYRWQQGMSITETLELQRKLLD